MFSTIHNRLIKSNQHITTICGYVAILIGGSAIAGWYFDNDYLRSINPNWVTMKMNTAIGLIMCGIASATYYFKNTRSFFLPLYFTFALSIAQLIEAIWGINLGIDELLIKDKLTSAAHHPGQMSSLAAVNFLLLATGFWLAKRNNTWAISCMQVISLLVLASSGITILGYWFSASEFFGSHGFNKMAINTAVCFFLLCVGMLMIHHEKGFMQLLTGNSSGSVWIRKIMPQLSFILIFSSGIALKVIQTGIYSQNLVFALFVVFILLYVIFITYRSAVHINLLEKERNAAHEQLSSNKHIQLILDQTQSAIFIRNMEGKYLYMNRMMEDMIQHKLKDVKGQHIREIYSQEIAASIIESDKTTAQATQPFVEEVTYNLNGQLKHFITTKFCLVDENQKPFAICGISLDITDRKMTEIKQSHLIAELENFAHVVSHDLKAPARGIAQLSEWILSENKDTLIGDSSAHLHLLRERALKLNAVIDGVLYYNNFARKEEYTTKVNTQKLVSDSISLMSVPSRISIDIPETLPIVRYGQLKLQQVFMNLLSNAIQYNNRIEGQIVIRYTEDLFFYTFCVEDNGIGINPIYHQKIFDLFQVLTPDYENNSTGVGLATIKKIVESYGGTIWVESEEQAGARFYFTVPK